MPKSSHATALAVLIVYQMLERPQVLQRLAARDPPLPFLLDRGPKTQLQQRIEVLIDGLEHLAEYAVDLVGSDGVQGHPADEVDVANVVQGVGDAVEPAVALEQELVEPLEVLVGLAADERLDAHRVLADGQGGDGDQTPLPRQLDDQPGQAAPRAVVVAVDEVLFLEDVFDDLLDAHLWRLKRGHPAGSRTVARCAAPRRRGPGGGRGNR